MNVSTHTVRISNLPEQFDEDDFTPMCQNINPKSKTRFFRNNNTGEMDFKSKKEAERCIEEYDEMDIDGGCLRVEVISIARFLCSLFSFAFCVCVCVSSLIFVDQTPLYLMKNSSSPPRATIEHATDDVGAATVLWGYERASSIAQPWARSTEKRIRCRRPGSDDVESGRGFGVRQRRRTE